jgi:hypothetical protein
VHENGHDAAPPACDTQPDPVPPTLASSAYTKALAPDSVDCPAAPDPPPPDPGQGQDGPQGDQPIEILTPPTGD